MGVLSTDTFNRANSSSTMGSTDGSGSLDPVAWSDQRDVWGISSNRAYSTNVSSQFPDCSVIETSQADIYASVDIDLTGGTGGPGAGVVFRLTDSGNFWYAEGQSTHVQLWRIQAFGNHLVAATASFPTTLTYTLSVQASGNTITVYKNGVGQITTSQTFNNTATKHGIGIDTDFTHVRVDNWLATPPTHHDVTDTVGLSESLVTHPLPFSKAISDSTGVTDVLGVGQTGAPLDSWRGVQSPDNHRVVFCSTPQGDHDTNLTHVQLWTVSPDGLGRKLVRGGPANYGWTTYGHPEWHPTEDFAVIWAETSTEFQLVRVSTTDWN